ncbi:nucleosome assembly protein 1;3 isoform X4 [Physcomitrium patens]|uniref:nucleosome assembly protein 1;3 isoform X4 n=1 Tax=Physcomitrium patens TaxID=3218 RepID=UPI000D160313|nr:nucleosome assembly protein 1;3-like isoform X4 [Physcomitrium patens]XP_024379423.1 nucleosome assembly protein 1;3-like isoform X4 [Physcomitrium patens]XP_024379424.1 nucleosome assembly protein 1;3-like isoform X4 [Physcomitrium patens]XP_024379425.1 nucleosome assembly protein 1;3-like isoform X4 [Physcomitrium patens]XP_024379426.1 nucleosome assembly protein 1;3-like isoform X4 [Physcomitrium patens]|eukprot:XP_024379422.1 nucleosome assembly protein 1;3-like isoform X4 [Physcomitrella patens]
MISWLCYSGSLVSDGSAVGETDTVALSDVDRETRVNVLKEKLQSLAGNPSGFLEKLPPKPKRRVIVLEGLQAEHDELEAKFKKERAALEAKCQKLYEERSKIVNGDVEVEVSKSAVPDAEEPMEEDEKSVLQSSARVLANSNE